MIKVLGKKLLVKPKVKEQKTKSGIFLVDPKYEIFKTVPEFGTVVSKSDVKEVDVGDEVAFGRFAGIKIKVDDEDYLILNERDLIGKYSDTVFVILGNRYLLEILPPEDKIKLKGSNVELVIPEDWQYHRQPAVIGIVKQKGALEKDDLNIPEGTKVVIKWNLGAKIKIDGKECRVVKPADIEAIMKRRNSND